MPNTLNTPVCRREDTPAGRTYAIEGVGGFPSVTSILDVIAKPTLMDWAARAERQAAIQCAADVWDSAKAEQAGRPPMSRLAFTETLKQQLGSGLAWKRERDEALKTGREAHALVEWHLRRLLGGTHSAPANAPLVGQPAMVAYKAFTRWLEDSGFQPRSVEQEVWSERYGYAGTFDVSGVLPLNGRRTIVVGDWKSSKRLFPEAVIQVSAYVVALREMGQLPLSLGEVWAFVVRLPKREGEQLEVHLVSPERQAYAFQAFLSALELWRWLADPLPKQDIQLGSGTNAGIYLQGA